LELRAAMPKSLFFSNVPYETSFLTLVNIFAECGTLMKLELFHKLNNSIGSGLVEYSTASEAARALRELSNAEVDGRPMQVKYDEDKAPREDAYIPAPAYGSIRGKGERPRAVATPYSPAKGSTKGSGKGGGGKRVFFSNVPFETNEGYLRKKFEDVGTIVDFDFWRKPDGKSMGMGTCEFDHPQGAKRALESLYDMMVDGRPLNIKMDEGGRDKGEGKGKR